MILGIGRIFNGIGQLNKAFSCQKPNVEATYIFGAKNVKCTTLFGLFIYCFIVILYEDQEFYMLLFDLFLNVIGI